MAVTLVVAACGSTSTPTFTATAKPSSGPTSAPITSPKSDRSSSPTSAAPTTSSSDPSSSTTSAPTTDPKPETSSSPTPPVNSAFPYKPGGVTYYGEGGAVAEFSIPAATYSLNQQASYDPANDSDGTGVCLFGGELDYLSGSGGTIPLGDNGVPISAQLPINGPPSTAPYPAGDYRLYIYPPTTCSWQVELWPDNSSSPVGLQKSVMAVDQGVRRALPRYGAQSSSAVVGERLWSGPSCTWRGGA